jgi:hypothetical protein
MPKWAIAWTIACAIIGQVMGARLERARLQQGRLPPAGEVAAAGPTIIGSCQADMSRQHCEGSWRQSLLIPALG